jgi:hypothetical protein
MLEKQGIQQELLPGAAGPTAGAPAADVAPVVARAGQGSGGSR